MSDLHKYVVTVSGPRGARRWITVQYSAQDAVDAVKLFESGCSPRMVVVGVAPWPHDSPTMEEVMRGGNFEIVHDAASR